jgi:hypothetical protein
MAVATSTAILGAAALGTGASLYGASQAAKAQKSAANRATDAQMAMFERQLELQEPFREAGLTAQNRLLTLLGLGADPNAADFGKYARDFGMKDFQTDPGYGFRLNEGMKALERSAAARGGLLSGSALKGSQRFGQDLASQEYMNAFNRYQTNRANQLNPLQSLMGAGQTSANVLTGAAGQTGQGMANSMMAAGAARASGYTGMASALNQGLSTGANLYMQYPLYQAMSQYYSRPSYGQVSGANVGGPGGL